MIGVFLTDEFAEAGEQFQVGGGRDVVVSAQHLVVHGRLLLHAEVHLYRVSVWSV
jgi:hypothetical protein